MKSIALFKQSLFMMLFSALAFTSCQTEDSADVNQDKIYTDYELFYNSNTDKTQVVARFRFGGPLGTLLELNDPASVKFDGEDVPFNALYSGHFKEFSGQVLEGTFLYTNVEKHLKTLFLFSNQLISHQESIRSQSLPLIQ